MFVHDIGRSTSAIPEEALKNVYQLNRSVRKFQGPGICYRRIFQAQSKHWHIESKTDNPSDNDKEIASESEIPSPSYEPSLLRLVL